MQLYESVVQALKPHGYTGIYVIYDEFSKYLEANISEASVSDTKPSIRNAFVASAKAKNTLRSIRLLDFQQEMALTDSLT